MGFRFFATNLFPVLASTSELVSCSHEKHEAQLFLKVDDRRGFAPVFYSSEQSAALSAYREFLRQSVIAFPSEGPPAGEEEEEEEPL